MIPPNDSDLEAKRAAHMAQVLDDVYARLNPFLRPPSPETRVRETIDPLQETVANDH